MKTVFTFICRLPFSQSNNSWCCRLGVACLIYVSLPFLSFAQNKIWDKTLGGEGADNLHVFQQTRDGGYILAGDSFSSISGDKSGAPKGGGDLWIVKLKADGTQEWDKTLGGTGTDGLPLFYEITGLNTLQQTRDGGYILGGASNSGKSGDKSEGNKGPLDVNENGEISNDFWVVKLDASGNKLWDKTLGGANEDRLNAIQQTNDGGYILGGSSNSGKSGDKSEDKIGDLLYSFDYWVVKLDANGNKVWDQTLGG